MRALFPVVLAGCGGLSSLPQVDQDIWRQCWPRVRAHECRGLSGEGDCEGRLLRRYVDARDDAERGEYLHEIGCYSREAPPAPPVPLAGRVEPDGSLTLPVAPWRFHFTHTEAGVRWVVSVPETGSTARLTGCADSALEGATTGQPAYRAVRTGATLAETLATDVPREGFARFAAGAMTGRVCGQAFQLQPYQRGALEAWLRAAP